MSSSNKSFDEAVKIKVKGLCSNSGSSPFASFLIRYITKHIIELINELIITGTMISLILILPQT